MENCGYIIGYDLNENGCQIKSKFHESTSIV